MDDGPDTIAFGIAALDARLDESDVAFPADAATVRSAMGDEAVPYNASGATITVAEALERTAVEHFENEQEFLNALHPVFEEARAQGGGGFLDRLRSLVGL